MSKMRVAMDLAKNSSEVVEFYNRELDWKDNGEDGWNADLRLCIAAVRAADTTLALGMSEPEIRGAGAQLHHEIRAAAYETIHTPEAIRARIIADLKTAREEQGLSQAELGRRLGYGTGGQGIVARWETDGRDPNTESLTKWAGALGYTLALVKQRGGYDLLPDGDRTE